MLQSGTVIQSQCLLALTFCGESATFRQEFANALGRYIVTQVTSAEITLSHFETM